jgi:hypothetical protein
MPKRQLSTGPPQCRFQSLSFSFFSPLIGIFSIPAYSGKDKPIIFSEELFFRNKRVKAWAFDSRQKSAAERGRVGNDHGWEKERKRDISEHHEICDSKVCIGDKSLSILKGLALG